MATNTIVTSPGIHRRLLISGVAISALLVPAVWGPSASAEIQLRCMPTVATDTVDPIVFPGSYPAGHEHVFSGSKVFGGMTGQQRAGAKYSQLAGKTTACIDADGKDTALYWVPTLYQRTSSGNKRIPVIFADAYYKSFDGQQQGAGVAYPADARLVTGHPENTGNLPSTKQVEWRCGGGSNRNGPYVSPIEAACDRATGTVRLTANVVFPSCWSGKSNSHTGPGNTADFHPAFTGSRQQYAYPVNGNCPAGYPNETTRVSFSFGWDYRGDGRDVFLSSDRDAFRADDRNVVPGSSLHGDFWNTWDQRGFRRAVRTCVNTPDTEDMCHPR